MNKDINNKVLLLERETFVLKRITEIRKILISNGAYSNKNMEAQEIKFLNADVPEWEKKIVRDSWDATKKISHSLFLELNELNGIILKEFETETNPIKEKTPKDILKERLKTDVDNL
jgi:hypothetical protein